MHSDNLCDTCRAMRNLDTQGNQERTGGRCIMCNARISQGPGNQSSISVQGTDHLEVLKVTQGLYNQHRSKPLHILVTQWSFWFSSLLAILGTGMAIYGVSGDSEISMFGQTVKSTNVGITAFFIGAALVWRNIKNVLHHDSQSPT